MLPPQAAERGRRRRPLRAAAAAAARLGLKVVGPVGCQGRRRRGELAPSRRIIPGEYGRGDAVVDDASRRRQLDPVPGDGGRADGRRRGGRGVVAVAAAVSRRKAQGAATTGYE